MLWFGVWTVLIAVTVIGAFFLARYLWRCFKALTAQVGQSAQVFERLNSAIAELAEAQQELEFSADLFAADAEKEQWRAARSEVRRERLGRKQARRSRTLSRWRAIGLPF